ncbi:MAG: glycosyltransferase family 9 protein [Cellvibrionaceae bacterium]
MPAMPTTLPLSSAPKSICLLRLSAIGDVTHILPIVRTIQQYWPETKITWIIGRLEHQLVGDIEGIEFIVFDKALGWRAYKGLYQILRKRSFDVFLHMQVSMRANLASLCVKAPIKLGFDKARAKDYQWLFSNTRIEALKQQHVLDGFFQFLSAMGLNKKVLRWDIPVPQEDIDWSLSLVGKRRVLVINPSSSQRANNWRNWQANRYAQLIHYAIRQYGMMVVLTGGPAKNETRLVEEILDDDVFSKHPRLLDDIQILVGKTSLKQLAALMQKARVVVAPDTGPAHIANAVGVPVIGLYATSNPKRTGPYSSQATTVNEYPAALLQYEGLDEKDAPWGKRVRNAEALDLISVEKVKEKLDQIMEATP